MKTYLLVLLALLSLNGLKAQKKIARLNTDQLTNHAYPEIQADYKDFQKYMDSIYTGMKESEAVKGYMLTIEKNDRSTTESQKELIIAQQQMNSIQNDLTDLSNRLYVERFGERLEKLNSKVNEFQAKNNYYIIFDYTDQGLGEMRYMNNDVRLEIENEFGSCLSMPKGLDANEYRKELDKRMGPCREQVLKPLYEASVDITSEVVESIGGN